MPPLVGGKLIIGVAETRATTKALIGNTFAEMLNLDIAKYDRMVDWDLIQRIALRCVKVKRRNTSSQQSRIFYVIKISKGA